MGLAEIFKAQRAKANRLGDAVFWRERTLAEQVNKEYAEALAAERLEDATLLRERLQVSHEHSRRLEAEVTKLLAIINRQADSEYARPDPIKTANIELAGRLDAAIYVLEAFELDVHQTLRNLKGADYDEDEDDEYDEGMDGSPETDDTSETETDCGWGCCQSGDLEAEGGAVAEDVEKQEPPTHRAGNGPSSD